MPAAAAALVLTGVLTLGERARVPAALLPLMILFVTFTLATGARGDVFETVKSMGVVGGWLAALWGGAVANRRERRLVVRVFLVVAFCQVLVMLGETILASDLVRSRIAATSGEAYVLRPNLVLGFGINRAQGTLGYPIPASTFLVVALTVVVFVRVASLLVRIMLVAFLSAGVLLTGTRGGLLALAVALAVGLVARSGVGLLARIVVAVVSAVGVIVVAPRFGDSLATGDEAFVHRFNILRAAGDIFHRPLGDLLIGSGLNSHGELYATGLLAQGTTGALDNAYVSLLVWMGLVGAAVVLGYLLVAFVSARRDLKPVLVAMAVHFVTYDALGWHAIALILWFVVGVALQRPADAVVLARTPRGSPVARPHQAEVLRVG